MFRRSFASRPTNSPRSATRRNAKKATRPFLAEPLEGRLLLSAAGEVFVTSYSNASIGEYATSGTAVNSALVNTGLGEPFGIAVSGDDVFVTNFGSGTIGEYTTAGVTVNSSLVTGLASPEGIVVSGSNLFVANKGSGTIGEYTTAGVTVNASLVTGLSEPVALAISGNDLFVANEGSGTIGEYATWGATVSTTLIGGLIDPQGLALSGSDLFVTSESNGAIGEFTTSGGTVNSALVTGLDNPVGIAVFGSDLFVANSAGNTVGEYTTGGSTVSASLISGLDGPASVAVVPTPGVSAELQFVQQPTDVAAAASITPAITVDVDDGYGNIVTTDDSNVTLAVKTGPGVAGGTLTVAAVDGVATFSAVTLNTMGTYTLTATDASLAAATSDSFTVSAAAASKLVFSRQPSNVTAGAHDSPAIIVKVEDAFGNVVTTDTSDVTLSVDTGPGGLTGTLTVAAVKGVATFSKVAVHTAGAYTLTASDGALTSATSSSFTVKPAAPASLVFLQQPSDVTAGLANSPAIAVEVEDAFGNLISGKNVTLAVKTGPGNLHGTLTIATVDGVATFSDVLLDTAGIYTLKAVSGSVAAPSSSFTVAPAAAAKLVIGRQPSTATAGVANSPAITVKVEDAFGNVVTTDTSNVTLAVSTGPGVLSGTTTVAAVNGVALFSNAVVDIAGAYTLQATDGALTAAVSAKFMVKPAAAATLAFHQEPNNVNAGADVHPAITVVVEDQFGNLATGSTSKVTLSVDTGPSTLSGSVTVTPDKGVATFSNVWLKTAGVYTLTASDGALPTATSSGFTVSPAAAAKLVFSQEPSDATAGIANSPAITVKIEDQFGNILVNSSANVTLEVHHGPGPASGTLTVAAVNGVATFSNVLLDTAGTYTLEAIHGSLHSATSTSFTISPAAAAKLVFHRQPSSVKAGVADAPAITVNVEDQFGNIVTSDTSDVTLALDTGPGVLSGTPTVAAVDGVATFSDIVLSEAGRCTLQATDGVLTAAVSDSFSVVA